MAAVSCRGQKLRRTRSVPWASVEENKERQGCRVSADVGNRVTLNTIDDAAAGEAVWTSVDTAGNRIPRRQRRGAVKDDVVRDLAKPSAHADGLVGVVGYPLEGAWIALALCWEAYYTKPSQGNA